MEQLKVLVVGCGNMGTSHARAYHKIDAFKIVGLVSRNPESRNKLSDELGGLPTYADFDTALSVSQPNVVSINTYPETHFDYAKKSLNAGAHVFLEKPLATTVEDAQELVDLAKKLDKKLVIGYILRVHSTWKKFTEIAQTLGKPLVMRMNLNQQSFGSNWLSHKQILSSMSPIVDCGVHYVDVMCQMTSCKPISVSAIGANLTNEISSDQYNYGQLQVRFEDGSVGWYEAGWGPMISETAFFVKDIIGPKGSISIIDRQKGGSQEIEGHTQTNSLLLHHSLLDTHGKFVKQDEVINTSDEPTHDELCELEQQYLLDAINQTIDITRHLEDSINSLNIVLAADQSFKTGTTIYL